MVLLIGVALQAAAVPDLRSAQWQYVGQSEMVAHYVDANSIERQGRMASAVTRIVYFEPERDRADNLFRVSIDCEERFYVRYAFFRVEGSEVQPWSEPNPLSSSRLPARFYPMVAATIDLACEGRPGTPAPDPVEDARSRASRRG